MSLTYSKFIEFAKRVLKTCKKTPTDINKYLNLKPDKTGKDKTGKSLEVYKSWYVNVDGKDEMLILTDDNKCPRKSKLTEDLDPENQVFLTITKGAIPVGKEVIPKNGKPSYVNKKTSFSVVLEDQGTVFAEAMRLFNSMVNIYLNHYYVYNKNLSNVYVANYKTEDGTETEWVGFNFVNHYGLDRITNGEKSGVNKKTGKLVKVYDKYLVVEGSPCKNHDEPDIKCDKCVAPVYEEYTKDTIHHAFTRGSKIWPEAIKPKVSEGGIIASFNFEITPCVYPSSRHESEDFRNELVKDKYETISDDDTDDDGFANTSDTEAKLNKPSKLHTTGVSDEFPPVKSEKVVTKKSAAVVKKPEVIVNSDTDTDTDVGIAAPSKSKSKNKVESSPANSSDSEQEEKQKASTKSNKATPNSKSKSDSKPNPKSNPKSKNKVESSPANSSDSEQEKPTKNGKIAAITPVDDSDTNSEEETPKQKTPKSAPAKGKAAKNKVESESDSEPDTPLPKSKPSPKTQPQQKASSKKAPVKKVEESDEDAISEDEPTPSPKKGTTSKKR